ncbi:uncharacterized protein NPIL_136921 [Nephila pilipes]|uniref:DUF7041 domain-containing protein n=1 Tax=Nephila pilipes TaxID=299642 RepID=A0A8X6QMQ3_NEPPI|nr:uncharacterized protein NPIL_136921 [Nephila pilipes]
MFNYEEADISNTKQGASISRGTFKIPNFRDDDLEPWSYKIKSQFIMAGITSESSKFHSVVSALRSNVISCVLRVLLKFLQQLKLRTGLSNILLRFHSSRLSLLPKDIQKGDKRTSLMLNKMRYLAPENVEDDILQILSLEKLPVYLHQVVSG